MEKIEEGIRKIAEVYDLDLPFGRGAIGERLSTLGLIDEVRLEIFGDGGRPLLIYRFTPSIFDGRVSLVVPIREELSGADISCRISADAKTPAFPSVGFCWSEATKVRMDGDQVWSKGMVILAGRELRSKGVVVFYDNLKGWGFIHSGARLFFHKSWLDALTPEPGLEVDFLPVALLGKGIQAREVRGLAV